MNNAVKNMKNIVLFTMIFCLSASFGAAQKTAPPIKKESPKPVTIETVTSISEAEWKTLTDSLQAEDWKNSTLLASQYLQKLKNDNEQKQLAQLRYLYLYSLAGKILAVSNVAVPFDRDALWKQLDEAVGSFVGKEFLLPARQSLTECKNVLNYICPVKDTERALRVTATNKEATGIHSFDYVSFDKKIALGEFAGRETFIGGRLKKAEFNEGLSKPWVMRLYFEDGFVRVVIPNTK